MSKHVPTLPTKSTWETPIAASREIVDAITDAADSAVDAATSAVRSVRRRRTPRRVVLAQWRWMLATAVVVAALVVWRRRSNEPEGSTRSDHGQRSQGSAGGRASHSMPGAAVDQTDDDLVDVGARHVRSAVVD